MSAAGPSQGANCSPSGGSAAAAAASVGVPLLEARDLTRHYAVSRGWFRPKGNVRALDGVTFSLREGATLAVVGESGCGKSTLARQVTMIERPTSGALLLDGNDVAHADAAARRRLRPRVQMVFQNPYASLNPRKTVGALLEEPLAINGMLRGPARREAGLAMLAKVGLRPEHYGRYPHMFSGGQRQRIAVARALMLQPRLVVADEPVSALDVSIQAQVLNLLMDLQQELGIAYLFIAHNLQVAPREHVVARRGETPRSRAACGRVAVTARSTVGLRVSQTLPACDRALRGRRATVIGIPWRQSGLHPRGGTQCLARRTLTLVRALGQSRVRDP
jgi:ABC-type oligopeptide transport system ATPase subunit